MVTTPPSQQALRLSGIDTTTTWLRIDGRTLKTTAGGLAAAFVRYGRGFENVRVVNGGAGGDANTATAEVWVDYTGSTKTVWDHVLDRLFKLKRRKIATFDDVCSNISKKLIVIYGLSLSLVENG